VIVRYGLRGAAALLDRTIKSILNSETAERSLVYHTVADQLGELSGFSESEIYRVVLVLCGEPDGGVLAEGLEAPDHNVMTRLSELLVGILVEYETDPGRQCMRRIRVLYGADEVGAEERRVEMTVPWDELPADVREHRGRTGDRRVSYQLLGRRD
jgi:hypothetical protein